MRKKLYILMLAIIVIMCGCNKGNSDEIIGGDDNYGEITLTNPFANVEMQENESVMASYGFRLNSNETEFVYADNRVALPLLFENGSDEVSFGIMVFVNGILQSYTSDISSVESTMQSFTLPAGSPLTCELYVDDIELLEKTDSAVVNIISILNSDYLPSSDSDILGFGANHWGTCLQSFTLNMQSEPIITNFSVSDDYDIHVLSEEEKKIFDITEKRPKTFFLVYPELGIYKDFITIDPNNESVIFDLKAFGSSGEDGDYRISMFKNHQRIKFNGGYDYMDIPVKNGYMTVAEIELLDVKPGDFVYCVAISKNKNSNSFKGGSIMIYDENEVTVDFNVSNSYSSYVPEDVPEDLPPVDWDNLVPVPEDDTNEGGWIQVENYNIQ